MLTTRSLVQETTERMVRKQVQARLGVDVSHRKAFIKEQVSVCLPFTNQLCMQAG